MFKYDLIFEDLNTCQRCNFIYDYIQREVNYHLFNGVVIIIPSTFLSDKVPVSHTMEDVKSKKQ